MRARAKAHKCPAVYLEKSEEDGVKKQKELSEFMDMTKKHESELTEKSDHVILEKLRAEGYKDLDTQNLFEIFYDDDKIREKIMNEIELQTDGDLQKISQRKENLLKELV